MSCEEEQQVSTGRNMDGRVWTGRDGKKGEGKGRKRKGRTGNVRQNNGREWKGRESKLCALHPFENLMVPTNLVPRLVFNHQA